MGSSQSYDKFSPNEKLRAETPKPLFIETKGNPNYIKTHAGRPHETLLHQKNPTQLMKWPQRNGPAYVGLYVGLGFAGVIFLLIILGFICDKRRRERYEAEQQKRQSDYRHRYHHESTILNLGHSEKQRHFEDHEHDHDDHDGSDLGESSEKEYPPNFSHAEDSSSLNLIQTGGSSAHIGHKGMLYGGYLNHGRNNNKFDEINQSYDGNSTLRASEKSRLDLKTKPSAPHHEIVHFQSKDSFGTTENLPYIDDLTIKFDDDRAILTNHQDNGKGRDHFTSEYYHLTQIDMHKMNDEK